MANQTITINRAPVLCLWTFVVAKRIGFRKGEALSLAKGVTGMTAQAKGRSLGIFNPSESKPADARKKKSNEDFAIRLLGKLVPVRNTDDGIRSLNKDKEVGPESVEKYLKGKFGDDLDAATEAMETLAKSMPRKELAERAFGLYEKFRPKIPAGTKGWGAKGELDLKFVKALT